METVLVNDGLPRLDQLACGRETPEIEMDIIVLDDLSGGSEAKKPWAASSRWSRR